MKKLILMLFLAACAAKPPSDKRIASKFTETREKSQYVYGSSQGGWVNTPYTAYILVATDNTTCEVTGREYAYTKTETLFLCEWKDQ